MKAILKIYTYGFYCFYRMDRWVKPQWLSHWKASFGLLVVEIWLIIGIIGQLSLISQLDWMPQSPYDWKLLIILIALIILKERLFFKNEKWKEIVRNFDSLPRKKNNAGMVVFVFSMALIVLFLVFTFYMIGNENGTLP